jgi:hypothetical protein
MAIPRTERNSNFLYLTDEYFPNRLRDQLLFPVLYWRRRVTRQQRDEREQRQPRIAEGVVKPIPVLAVFSVVN